jgi:hypothetical protein
MTEEEQNVQPDRDRMHPVLLQASGRARLAEWERALRYIEAQIAFAEESGLGPLMIALWAAKAEAERGAATMRENVKAHSAEA